MKILIASDSFKDALPALEACQAIARGIQQALPAAEPILFPLADGGEGTADILTYHSRGQRIELEVNDPLFRPVLAAYGLSGDGQTAFIEMAAASGLPLLWTEDRNPLYTTTFGTGELIQDAVKRGVRRILLGIGGSATNDCGMGLAAALGYRFLDEGGEVLPATGANLSRVSAIDSSHARFDQEEVQVEVLCDVDNPLYGEGGAAFVYAPQKGADELTVSELDAGLRHFAKLLEDKFGQDFAHTPGAGAAGGLGAGAMAFLGASLRPGIAAVMELSGFDARLADADLVITGEGKIDRQTLHGKLIYGITRRAQAQGVPVIALCGALLASPEEIEAIGLKAAFCIQNRPLSLAEALPETALNLERTAHQVASVLSMG
ncbi:MAG: glycerate kinase [Phaeodactylibacter sp.]|nr:glycerate kinase [Phaeodactylibacter sp.]MCB9299340.1 glycerate kinase [Lewinellaceae bacterium]HQU57754.1 glycerate kinase [Saprospiraceae bacterium]